MIIYMWWHSGMDKSDLSRDSRNYYLFDRISHFADPHGKRVDTNLVNTIRRTADEVADIFKVPYTFFAPDRWCVHTFRLERVCQIERVR